MCVCVCVCVCVLQLVDKKYTLGFNFELFECMNEWVVFNMAFLFNVVQMVFDFYSGCVDQRCADNDLIFTFYV